MNQLEAIQKKMEEGQSLRHLFDELKRIQTNFKKHRFSRKDHSTIWDKLDGLFKDVKEKKYGNSKSGNNPVEKAQRRLDGLKSAIDRMKKSISRDQKELKFQKNKIENADGQLEAQIRQAKLLMLEERIHSKEIKLEDMLKTEKQLNQRVVKIKEKVEKEQAEQKIKERIAKEILEKQEKMDHDPKVLDAAAKITGHGVETEGDSLQETASVIKAVISSSRDSDINEEE